MKRLKAVIMVLLAIVLVSASVPASAAQHSTDTNGGSLTNREKLTIGVSQKEEMNDWVFYDEENRSYSVKEGARGILSEESYKLLCDCIRMTNLNLAQLEPNARDVIIITPEQEYLDVISIDSDQICRLDCEEASIKSTRGYSEGVTKIVFHWWGYTVYISKTTINYISGGIAIGGIWVPEPVVSKVLGTLGVLGTLVPGGIAFDYSFIQAGLVTLFIPGGMCFMSISGIRNIRWQ